MNNKNQRVLGFTLLASVCALPSHAEPIVWKAGNLSINPYGILDLNVQTGSFSKTAPRPHHGLGRQPAGLALRGKA